MDISTTETTVQLQLLQSGGPFKIANVPKAKPGPDEVLIRQRVIAFNLIDVKQRDHGIAITQWPRVLGIEGAGVVEAVGTEVQHIQPGDEVAGRQGVGAGEKEWGGAFQELVAAPADFVFKKPQSISIEEASSLPIGYLTAVSVILGTLKIPLPFLPDVSCDGKVPLSVLILGGSSATGAALIQLLRKAYPALPILATSSEKHHTRLLGLGATSTIDYRSTSTVADIKAASPGAAGVDVIVDCVSAGADQPDISDALDPTGAMKYAGVVTGIQVTVPTNVEYIPVMASAILDAQGGKSLIPSLTRLVDEGIYKVPLPVRVVGHGLEALPSVIDEVKKASGEKIVITV